MSTAVDQIEITPFECPAVMLPTPGNMKDSLKQIAAMPAKIGAMLEVQAVTMTQNEIDGLMSEIEKLEEVVELILDVIDAPNFTSIDWPDLRAEIGVDKIFQKFPTWTQVQMIKLITEILPIEVEVPVSLVDTVLTI